MIKYIMIILITFNIVYSYQKSEINILYINSYHKGFVWSDNILEEIFKMYNQYNFNVEYLDGKRSNKNDLIKKQNFLLDKYKNKKIDLILTSDDLAFQFVLNNPLVFNSDIIFSGVNYNYDKQIKLDNRFITGVYEKLDLNKTLSVINDKRFKNLYILYDNKLTSNILLTELKKTEQNYKFNFIYKNVNEFNNNIKEDSAFLILSLFTQKYQYKKNNILNKLNYFDVPIFSLWEFDLHKSLGGCILSSQQHAELFKQQIDSYFNEEYPKIVEDNCNYHFNKQLLKHFKLQCLFSDDNIYFDNSIQNKKQIKTLPFYFIYIIIILILSIILIISIFYHYKRNLIQDNRYSTIGKMNNKIIHQWKQPLNQLSLITYQILQENNKVEKEELYNNISNIITHMSDTLNDFNFFIKGNENLSEFSLNEIIQRTIQLVKFNISKNIEFVYISEEEIQMCGYENDIKHILMNIISNAIEIFKERKIENPKLIIKSYIVNQKIMIEINDNAGGVENNKLNKLFSDFSEKKNGVGLGLQIVKELIKKNEGKIFAENKNNGLNFVIELPLNIKEKK